MGFEIVCSEDSSQSQKWAKIKREINYWKTAYKSTIRPLCVCTNRDENLHKPTVFLIKIALKKTHTTTYGGVRHRLYSEVKTVYKFLLKSPFRVQLRCVLHPYAKDCFNNC